MNRITDAIKQKRIEKGWSQQDLANKTKLSLRTIQRIENGETQPREVTIHLLSQVLELDKGVIDINSSKKHFGNYIMDFLMYASINILLMLAIGLFTLDSFATFYTRIAAVLLSFFIPYFIVSQTLHLKQLTRFLRYGLGYVIYVVLLFAFQGFEKGFFAGFGKGFFFCILISVFTLYYGDSLFRSSEKNKVNYN